MTLPLPGSRNPTTSSLGRSALWGGIGFGLASLCVFATVAFAERWMYATLGLAGAYAAWTALFIGLGGSALRPLARALPAARFWSLWALSFFAYALGWIGAYFTLGGTEGEAAGLFVGAALMALVFAWGFRVRSAVRGLFIVLFFANLAGYFVGSAINNALGGKAGMLVWGGVYGLCLGAGLGATLHLIYAASDRTRAPAADA